ncbi:MAG TPA: VOC family protein [Acidimicrobiales bacterium]|jgi:catechol-2,3-dioxygenase|nr:VOC family protein [Acidimicrobiales bacterium]
MDDFIPVTRLNHVALKVRDLETSVDFYTRVMGFTEDVGRFGNDTIAFLRAPGSINHHDLALLHIGAKAADANARSVGLFHCAWEVASLRDLLVARDRFLAEGCFNSQADHGATKAVYGTDPDGNTIEITWMLPREQWGSWETDAPIKTAIDLDAELARLS